MWDSILSWDLDWGVIATAVAGIIMFILEKYKAGKYRQTRDDALLVSRVTYSAIEEANSKDVKVLVAEAIEEVARSQPGVKEINDVMTSIVDAGKASTVPPLKLWWRRALANQNAAGVIGRIAMKAAIKELLTRKEDSE